MCAALPASRAAGPAPSSSRGRRSEGLLVGAAAQYGGRTSKKDKERLQLPTSGKEAFKPLNAPPEPEKKEEKKE